MTGPWIDLPLDYLFTLTPWMDYRPGHEPADLQLNDLALQIVPWAHQVRESWKMLEWPLWNANAGAGYPLIGNGQSAAFSIFRLLALPFPLGQSFTAEAALKLLVALGATFVFLRRRGASSLASLVGAVSFAFSTVVLIWLHFPLGSVSVWLPAVFLGVDLLFERRSFIRILYMILVFTQLPFGGHPETALHITFGATLWLVFRVLTGSAAQSWKARLAPVGAVAGAGVVALLIALPQILPLLEALPHTKRWSVIQEYPNFLDVRADSRFLVSFIQPRFFGDVNTRSEWGPAHAEPFASYGGILAGVAWLGMLIWLLAKRAWRDDRLLFAIAIPVLIGVVMGWPIVSELFASLPLFSIAANGRLRLLVIWFAIILAASLIDQLRAGIRWPALAGVLGMAAALSAAFLLNIDGREWTPVLQKSLETSLPGIAVLAVLLLAATVPMTWRRRVLPILLAAVIFDLTMKSDAWRNDVPEAYEYPRTPIITKMQQLHAARSEGDPFIFRIAGTHAMMFPNLSALYGFEDVRAHDPMANSQVLGVLRVFTGYTSDTYFGFLRDLSHPLIDFMNVHYVMMTRIESLPGESWELVYEAPDGRIWRNRETLPRFFAVSRVISEFDDEARIQVMLDHPGWHDTAVVKRLPTQVIEAARADLFGPRSTAIPPATVRITKAARDHFELDVDAKRWSLVVSSQSDWPGWKVVRNGNERLKTIRANAAFMSFLVPPGRSTIRVHYAPKSFTTGIWIAAATLTSLMLAGILSARRRRANL